MKERKEVLDFCMGFPEVYVDAPFHDDNWLERKLFVSRCAAQPNITEMELF